MKKILFVVSALAILMGISASCQKELNNGQAISAGEGSKSSLVVTATIADNGTKVSYAEDGSHNLTPTWVVNDIIIGFDNAETSKTYAYKVISVDGTTKKATLERITEGDETAKGTATSDPANGTKMYMFYAPGANPSAINTTDKSLTVSLANQAKDVVPALMMAEATVTDGSLSLSFSNQTAIIGIKTPTMSTASKTYTGIAVSGAGINTEVKFEINTSGNLEATYQTPGRIIKAVDFTSGTDKKTSATVYIAACKLTTAADLTFTASNGESFTKTSKTMAAGQYYYMTPTFSAPPVALSGEFTVKAASETEPAKKVRFSPGNLRCYPVGTSGVWSFFDKQYECGPASYTDGHDKEISLFTWGYNAKKSIIPNGITSDNVSRTSGDLIQTEDWGSQIGDGNTWRTLTKDEWKYLFNKSNEYGTNNRSDKYKYGVTVCGKANCVVLLPDDWNTSVISLENFASTSSYSEETSPKWSTMEAAGAVCLPAAGYRNGASVSNVPSNYWSSTASASSSAYIVSINNTTVNSSSSSRSYGSSVRLITECQ